MLHAHDHSGDNDLLKSWLHDHEGRRREGVGERVEAIQVRTERHPRGISSTSLHFSKVSNHRSYSKHSA